MSAYRRDESLRLRITRDVQQWQSSLARDIVVTAFADGTVYLRGLVSDHRDCDTLENLVSHVSGVTCVFCNVGVRSMDRRGYVGQHYGAGVDD